MLPRSFPKPDCLNPPKGAATSVLLYVFTKTVPAAIRSATRKAYPKQYIVNTSKSNTYSIHVSQTSKCTLEISLVNTPDARPNSVLFARRTTPSKSLTQIVTQIT